MEEILHDVSQYVTIVHYTATSRSPGHPCLSLCSLYSPFFELEEFIYLSPFLFYCIHIHGVQDILGHNAPKQ